MSKFYTSLFTVWPDVGRDSDHYEQSYGSPTVFRGLFKNGGNITLTDDKGQEFKPKSTFWTRLEIVSGLAFVPNNGDHIARGDLRGITSPENTATQQIRGQTIEDNSMHGEPVDYIFGTM